MEPGGKFWGITELEVIRRELDRAGGATLNFAPAVFDEGLENGRRLDKQSAEVRALWNLSSDVHHYTYRCLPEDVPEHNFDFIHLAEAQLGIAEWQRKPPPRA